MSPRLPRVTARKLVRALKRVGWYEARQQGTSHLVLVHDQKPEIIVVPMHRSQDLSTGLIRDIIKTAGLSPDEFRRLL